jgi:S1-C subfamily serine protease
MQCRLFAVLFLSIVFATSAMAESLSIHQDNGDGSLSWHDGNRALIMESSDRQGIRVVEAKPEGVLGLRTSDVILAVDGHAVTRINVLLDKLHASKSATAKVLVRRDGKPQVVTVAVSDYMRFMPPKPPTPPTPPVPPTPPSPPPPPPPPTSGW